MQLLASYRERVRQRPDSEHSQALLRAVIVWLLTINTAWVAAHDPGRGTRLWAINIFSATFSVLLLARILQRPAASPRRRVVGAIHDNITATVWLYNSGPMGALGLFIFPFVTVGNGFRFGVRYLAWSGFLGGVGIGILVTAAPGWASHQMIGYGVLLSHILVTVYTGALLRRLHETQSELAKLATCDALTGLPNRRLFMDRLSRMMVAPDRGHLACLYLDLDGFKAVNDRFGHKVGDQLLNKVARAILSCIRASDMLARMGGDEFTVILDVPSCPDDAKVVADRIIKTINGITSVDGHRVAVSVSIGISFVPAGDSERLVLPEELLKIADEAMYVAKRSGKGQYRFADLATGTVAAA